MNAMLPLFAATVATAATGADRASNLLAAARALTVHFSRSRPLDRRLVARIMTTTFGQSDTEGAWLWRDAYDAIETAMVLQLRRLGPQLERLEDAPSEMAALLANLSGLGLTHSRRSDEQVTLDQFSTPPELGALAVLAGQVRPGDHVLEPSAGHGLIAVLAEACGAEMTLNERAVDRAAVLDGLFPGAARHRLDALHLRDALPASGSFHAVLANPPFQRLEAHLAAALACLAEGGRLSAIVPARMLEDGVALAGISAYGRIVARLPFYPNAFAKHGTSVDTGLLVVASKRAGSSPRMGCSGCANTSGRSRMWGVRNLPPWTSVSKARTYMYTRRAVLLGLHFRQADRLAAEDEVGRDGQQ